MGVKKGFKETELGVIPVDWEVVKISDIAELRKEAFDPKQALHQSYCIELEHIASDSGKIIGHTETNINSSQKLKFYNNDILFGKLRAYLKKYWFAVKTGVTSTEVWVIKSNQNFVTPQYLYQIIKGDEFLEAASETHGTHMPRSDWKIVRELLIPIPTSIPEQQKIAAVLSDTDALIAATEHVLAKKRLVKQATLQNLLSGKTRLPGFGGEWETASLSDIANIQRGASPRPIDSPIWFDLSSNTGWVRISDLTSSNGIKLNKTEQYLSDLGIKNSRFLPKGSLIMSICATIGVPVITTIDTCIHDGFVGFTNVRIDQEYLYYFLKSNEKIFKEQGQTGSQNNLNTDIVKNYSIHYPKDIPEQTAIAEVLTAIDDELTTLEQQLAKYRLLKQGLMQELLSGKTRLV